MNSDLSEIVITSIVSISSHFILFSTILTSYSISIYLYGNTMIIITYVYTHLFAPRTSRVEYRSLEKSLALDWTGLGWTGMAKDDRRNYIGNDIETHRLRERNMNVLLLR